MMLRLAASADDRGWVRSTGSKGENVKGIRLCALVAWVLISVVMLNAAIALPAVQTTAFTYQGQLNAGGVLPSGQTFQFTFTLYDAVTGGNVVGTPINRAILIANGGLFTADLDFGQIFNGTQLWLEIKVGTTVANEQTLANRQPINATPVAQYALNSPAGVGKKSIQFSTGIILSGATVVSAAPILMGFGNHTVEVIDGAGESTMPPEAGGFSFPVPFAGTIQDLQISADLLVASVVSINTLGLQYDFTVFRAPSVPNNGIDHPASGYVTTPLTSSLRFGFPNTVVTAGTFRSATNISFGTPLVVAAGDRIGVRIRTSQSTDPSAADITQLSFSATLSFTPTTP
jgi:hypothetical protein